MRFRLVLPAVVVLATTVLTAEQIVATKARRSQPASCAPASGCLSSPERISVLKGCLK